VLDRGVSFAAEFTGDKGQTESLLGRQRKRQTPKSEAKKWYGSNRTGSMRRMHGDSFAAESGATRVKPSCCRTTAEVKGSAVCCREMARVKPN
jgi:hypothetical protein